MKRTVIIILFLFACKSFAGPYSPQAGVEGSIAVDMYDPNIQQWASGVEITRGLNDINDPDYGDANHGEPYHCLGHAYDGSGDNPSYGVCSLGDAGQAILTFDTPIMDREGYDFAVFENAINSLDGDFLELAFVYVSSTGNEEDYVLFPSVSLTPTDEQVHTTGTIDTTNIHNLAGKFLHTYGTPFDLSELKGADPNLNIYKITHIKLVDVVGTISPDYSDWISYDSQGNIINDPWPNEEDYPYLNYAGGFDLDAVGVMNMRVLYADFDSTDTVDFFDFQRMAKAFGTLQGQAGYDPACDISETADGIIDFRDMKILFKEWMK